MKKKNKNTIMEVSICALFSEFIGLLSGSGFTLIFMKFLNIYLACMFGGLIGVMMCLYFFRRYVNEYPQVTLTLGVIIFVFASSFVFNDYSMVFLLGMITFHLIDYITTKINRSKIK
jgi:hypothetical protein